MNTVRHRKRRILAALLCALAVFAFGAANAEKTEGSLTVGVPTDRCPIFYIDPETGAITGIGVDLMRTAAEAAGYTDVTFTAIREATLKEALDSSAYDVLMPFGSAITSAAGQASAVSENLIQTPFTLVTEGNHTLPPLNTLRVGMLRSLSGAADTVRQLFPGIEITLYETMAECVNALRAGKVDALLHNSYVWSYVLQKPAYEDLDVQPSTMFSMDFRAGAADTPEGRAVIEKLNGGIAALTDTRRQAVILDHTSRKLYRYDVSDYLYRYGLFAVLGVMLLVAVIVIALQKQKNMRMEQEEKLRMLIDHDPLTGALSMDGFRKRVTELVKQHPDTPYMISYSNIKNFKFINESIGREGADELLRFWVSKSTEVLDEEEEAIGRTSADHFVVLRRVTGDEQMLRDREDVFDPVRNYFINRGKEQKIQICSGVYVLTPEDYRVTDVDQMVDFARLAEKRVRDTRKDGYEFYNPQEWEKGKRVAEIVGHLPVAIRDGELQVWYQPQVDYETGTMTGTEALCRWNHRNLGWMRPADFIPLLEEAGLIYELDCFVWETVCRDLQRWNEQGRRRSVSVNLSRIDLREDRNIPGYFYDLVQKYGLGVDQLRIEITETAFAESPELLINTTVKLREFGFQVEMDDFGSGYSSLHMLKEVPVDRIKLDLHFLTGTGDVEKSRIIVTHIIQMVRSLGMKLIAEGVENAAQAHFLHSRGCEEMQGFYFFKPMTVQEFEQLGPTAPKAGDDE